MTNTTPVELFAEVTAPKGATFAAKRKGRESEQANPQAVKWVTDGAEHYVPAPINKALKAALDKAARQENRKVSYVNGVMAGENVVKVVGSAKEEDKPVEAQPTEENQAA